MEIKFIKSSLSYESTFPKPIRTLEYGDPTEIIFLKYLHRLTLQDDSEEVTIKFVSGTEDIIPRWVQYHYSDKRREALSKTLFSEMEGLRSLSEKQMRSNIDRFREQFIKDYCFGKETFRIDDNKTYNPNLNYEIEIQDLKITGLNGELSYQKRGVYRDDEKPMIISNYRNLIEWTPKENRLKLINLGIFSGQKYPYQSRRFIVFEIDYGETPTIKMGDQIKKKDIDIDKWYYYVYQVVGDKDMKINNTVFNLLKHMKAQ